MSVTSKKAGLLYLITNVCGNIAGSGALIAPIMLARNGSISIISLLVTAGASLCFAYCFAELSIRSNAASSANSPFYQYVYPSLGVMPAKVVSMLYFVSNVMTNLLLSIFITNEIKYLLLESQVQNAGPVSIAITLAMLTVTTIGMYVNDVKWLQISVRGSFFIKAALLTLIIVLGLLRFNPSYLIANFNLTGASNWQAFQKGVGIICFCLLGMESGGFLIKIAQNPREDLPKAMVLGTALAVVFYALILLAILGSLPSTILLHAVGSVPAILLGQFTTSIYAKACIRGLVIAACYGGLNSWIFNANEAAKFLSNDLRGTPVVLQTPAGKPLWLNVGCTLITLSALLSAVPDRLVLSVAIFCSMITFAIMFLAYLRLAWGDAQQTFWVYWRNIGVALTAGFFTLYYLTIIGSDIVHYFA